MDPGALTTDGDGRLPRILVVDDSRMVRASIVKHIRGRFEAREEPDGEAAWEALLVDPAIEIVLTDIGMPRLDGYGLLGRLRASKLPRVRDLPVVIISGDEDESARARALALGANGFVTKGTGGVELLATLMSLLRLSKAQGELERSRAALERQSPVDPESGLATEAYLEHHGAQAVAEARRRQADIGAMVIEIDQFDELATRYGVQVVQLILRKLGKLVSGRIRAEDTLSQHGQACFALLSPGIDRVSTCAFALRLRASVEKLVMAYRDERIRVTLSIGVASAVTDGREAIGALLTLAQERATQAHTAGGNRVVAEGGEVDPAAIERELARVPSVDGALRLLRAGARDEVAGQLPELVGALLPLLELLESRLQSGLPLARLREFHDKGGGSVEDRNGFWGEQAQLIHWNKQPEQIYDFSKPPFVKWFVGGETNLCYNAVDRHAETNPNGKALVYISTETDEEKIYSFAELRTEVMRMAAIYQDLGVKKGDRVLIYMPMIAEACFAMLACARIGAIHSVVFGGFASHSLATRIDDAKPTVIVSSDAGMRGGRPVPYKHLLDEAIGLAEHKPAAVLMVNRGLDKEMNVSPAATWITPPCVPSTWMPRCPSPGSSPPNPATSCTPPAPPASPRACSATPAATPWPWPRR
jgi:two-component system cell cycle response regulator